MKRTLEVRHYHVNRTATNEAPLMEFAVNFTVLVRSSTEDEFTDAVNEDTYVTVVPGAISTAENGATAHPRPVDGAIAPPALIVVILQIPNFHDGMLEIVDV